jgi:lysophospholipid acyltransferase (LPLAT)-like uncharacterized protein
MGFPPPNSVYCLWHQDLPGCMAAFRDRGIAVLISQSGDGEYAAEVARALGYQVFRGSSSRGQATLRGLIAPLRNGASVGMALDGPRGPAQVAKPGAKWLASQTQSKRIMLDVRLGFSLRLGSWDQTRIPLPFSVVQVFWSEIQD